MRFISQLRRTISRQYSNIYNIRTCQSTPVEVFESVSASVDHFINLSIDKPEMEFTTISTHSDSDGRCGQLDLHQSVRQIEQMQENEKAKCTHTFPTPMFFIHTVAGCIPHITSEVLEILFGSKPMPPVQISIDSIHTVVGSIGSSGMGLSKFVGLPACSTLLTINNPLKTLPPNYNDKFGISIWSRIGRETLTISNFNKIIGDLKPNLHQLMSDYDISKSSSKKRLKKSIDRNLDYMEKHFATMKSTADDGSRNSAFATIEFNWFFVDGVESSKAISSILENRDKIAGFVINGVAEHLNNNAQDQEKLEQDISKKEVIEILSTILSKLPDDKPKYVPGPLEPSSILQLVKLGVDRFDSSFVTQLTDKGQALNLSHLNKFVQQFQNGAPVPVPTETIVAKVDDVGEDMNADASFGILDLHEKRYFEDLQPISETCKCYTCRKYTRSYIHHLLVTEELLAMVLLMGHNLYSFDCLFQAIRQCLDTDTIRSLDSLQEIL